MDLSELSGYHVVGGDAAHGEYYQFICNDCGKKLDHRFEHISYCPNCGKKLDWCYISNLIEEYEEKLKADCERGTRIVLPDGVNMKILSSKEYKNLKIKDENTLYIEV